MIDLIVTHPPWRQRITGSRFTAEYERAVVGNISQLIDEASDVNRPELRHIDEPIGGSEQVDQSTAINLKTSQR